MRDLIERLVLYNLRTALVMIRSELVHRIGVNIAGIVQSNCGPGKTPQQNRRSPTCCGNNLANTKLFGFSALFGAKQNGTDDKIPNPSRLARICCLRWLYELTIAALVMCVECSIDGVSSQQSVRDQRFFGIRHSAMDICRRKMNLGGDMESERPAG